MKHEDLIRKLESLKIPEIEVPSHRQALRTALLNARHFKKRTGINWAKILAPVTATVLLMAVAGFFGVIQPQLEMAQAKKIVMSDPQAQQLIEKNELRIIEVELQNGEAFVLAACPVASLESCPNEDKLAARGEGSFSTHGAVVSGYILRVDLSQAKVTGFGKVDEITGLGDVNLEDMNFAKFEASEDQEHEDDPH
ncbi:MAG: hypothetical protein ACUVTR_00635 [Dehalococcoidia bacterium]